MPLSPSLIFKMEPALVVGVAVAAIIFVAQQFNIVLEEDSLTEVLAPIITAIFVRPTVTPNHKVYGIAAALNALCHGILSTPTEEQISGGTLTVKDSEGTDSLVIDADAAPRTPSAQEIEDAKRELDLP